ncbi:MAG TPA: DUF2703 domain-containing protein [Rhodobacteraceae bacterium]|nr:DUF2703 domain-containing protein [Paracoccaceae bacterium]
MGCECDCKTETSKAPALREVKLEFLYLDEAACEPCGEAAQTVETDAEVARGPFAAMGVVLNIEKKHITGCEVANNERLLTSPTICVGGVDIDPAVTEDNCPSCGTLARDDAKVDCRVWHWRGEVFPAAPVGRIVESLMAAAIMPAPAPTEAGEFTLPKNLKRVFAAKEKGATLGC